LKKSNVFYLIHLTLFLLISAFLIFMNVLASTIPWCIIIISFLFNFLLIHTIFKFFTYSISSNKEKVIFVKPVLFYLIRVFIFYFCIVQTLFVVNIFSFVASKITFLWFIVPSVSILPIFLIIFFVIILIKKYSKK
jgi:hypothetical protein